LIIYIYIYIYTYTYMGAACVPWPLPLLPYGAQLRGPPLARSVDNKQVINRVVVGPFEEEEKGVCILSDEFKEEDEDPATPGSRMGKRVKWHFGDPFREYVLLDLPLRGS
jgi:hypothetical protein